MDSSPPGFSVHGIPQARIVEWVACPPPRDLTDPGIKSSSLTSPPCNAEFNPWVGKIPWRRKWQPTPVFLPGEFHGQRSLAGCSPWCHKESDTIEWLSDNTIHNLGRLFQCSLLCRLRCLLSRMNHKNGLMAPKSPVVICMRWSSTWELCSPLTPQKQTQKHTHKVYLEKLRPTSMVIKRS